MSTATTETDVLIRTLDHEPEAEAVRHQVARLILRLLVAEDRPLTTWEKMHFEMAIALLPTVWLRLCVTHLKMAQEGPVADSDVLQELERTRGGELGPLTRGQLIDRLLRIDDFDP